MPAAGPLTPEPVAASGACIGLLRWDAGSFTLQPLAVETTVGSKAVAVHAGGLGRGPTDKNGRQGREGRQRRRRGAARTRGKVAAEMTETRPPPTNRRQVLYWRLLARLFDSEEQPTLESASMAVVDDIGLPAALLDPQASVDTIVQRHPELAAEFDGLMAPDRRTPTASATGPPRYGGPRWCRRCCSTCSPPVPGTVTAGQLARWQSDAGWFERALGCEPGELRGGRPAAGTGRADRDRGGTRLDR